MMQRLFFVCDAALDAQFPEKRLCRAVMHLKDGRTVTSAVHEPTGEAFENIGYDWLAAKFRRITANSLSYEAQTQIIEMIRGGMWKTHQLVDTVNELLVKQEHKAH